MDGHRKIIKMDRMAQSEIYKIFMTFHHSEIRDRRKKTSKIGIKKNYSCAQNMKRPKVSRNRWGIELRCWWR